MSEWFQAKVKFAKQLDNGLIKQSTELYLIDAVSFTDAETRAFKEAGEGMRDVQAVSIARSPIKEVVFYGDTDVWHKVKVCYSIMDEDTEKEKKVTTHFLVNANDVKEAYERTEEHLKTMLVPFTIPKVEESPIIDVFQYQKAAPAGYQKVSSTETTGQQKASASSFKEVGRELAGAYKVTADLIKRREDVKNILGTLYESHISKAKEAIRKEMKSSGEKSPIKAVLAISEAFDLEALEGSVLIAAAVEMVDESDESEIDCAMEGDSVSAFDPNHTPYICDAPDAPKKEYVKGEWPDPTDGQAVVFSLSFEDYMKEIRPDLPLQEVADIKEACIGRIGFFRPWMLDNGYTDAQVDRICDLCDNEAAFDQDEDADETDLEGRFDAVYKVDPLWTLLNDNGILCLNQDLHEIRSWKDSPFRDFHECMDAQFDATETVSKIVFEYLQTENDLESRLDAATENAAYKILRYDMFSALDSVGFLATESILDDIESIAEGADNFFGFANDLSELTQGRSTTETATTIWELLGN